MTQAEFFAEGQPYDKLSTCGRYRYLYGHRWYRHGTIALFILLNPSTGTREKPDPTIRKCRGFARRWQCAGFEIVNLFAVRSSDPRQIESEPDPVGPGNDREIAAALDHPRQTTRIIAAWGSLGWDIVNARAESVIKLIRSASYWRPIEALRISTHGHPWHPLYVPYSAQLQELSP